MNNVPQKLIDEAAKRGIVPGAVIRGNNNLLKKTVPPYSDWSQVDDQLFVGDMWYWGKDKWQVTVITHSPTKEPEGLNEPEGLKEGDACECGPAMRATILELAKELGVPYYEDVDLMKYQTLFWGGSLGHKIHGAHNNFDGRNPHTPEAFIAKMRVTASKPKPIKIGDHTVDFLASGDIKVGGTSVDLATLEAVYNKAKATKP